MRWVGHVEHIEDRGETHRVLVCRPKGQGDMDWMDLYQNRGRCWAHVNVVITFSFHKMQGIS